MCRTGERAFINIILKIKINNTQTYENQNRQEERTSALCIDEIRDFLDPKKWNREMEKKNHKLKKIF